MVREQLGLALNRAGRGEEAERVLTSLIEERGPSSETYGILGRVYKDRWDAALKAGERFARAACSNQAIDGLPAAGSRPTGATPIPASTP